MIEWKKTYPVKMAIYKFYIDSLDDSYLQQCTACRKRNVVN